MSGRLCYVEGTARVRPGESPNSTGQRFRASVVGPGLRAGVGKLLFGECWAVCSTVSLPAGFKLNPARRPNEWTTVAVPRRL